jgi:hypothetical protein
MLRNIPNRIDQPMLKQIIDDTSFGKFDFMYLRIDFTNNCNVGYAFINFQLPEDIIPFVMSIVGQRWANSDKVAEVSYATMQGRETLVQKFRNSSVMNEAPASRPKVCPFRDVIEITLLINPAFLHQRSSSVWSRRAFSRS